VEAAKILSSVPELFALEMNVSCPNVKVGGIAFGQDPSLLGKLTSEVKKHCKKPLIVKLTPNVTSIPLMAKAAETGGADAISLINTLRGISIDIKTKRPVLANVSGGYSGKAIKPVAVLAVYETAKVVKIPVIGMGGIYTAEDVIEFMMAGASAVQVGTAIFADPNVCYSIAKDLMTYCEKNKIAKLSSLISAAS